MGKASSAKKVARAARAGGTKRTARPRLTFPLAIVGILVLGGATVVYARGNHESLTGSEAKPSSKAEDHWHEAYGFYACDKFAPALKDITENDPLGIHTHGDGVIHVHPFKPAASGERARLDKWGPMVGVEFYDNGWKLPDGTEYRQGIGHVRRQAGQRRRLPVEGRRLPRRPPRCSTRASATST